MSAECRAVYNPRWSSEAANDDEEAALQTLGDLVPTSTAGAAALLAYMAEVEGDFADKQSPLLRTVLSVAKGLDELHLSPAA